MRVRVSLRGLIPLVGLMFAGIWAVSSGRLSPLGAGEPPSTAAANAASAPPPLMIEDDAPLLLDESPKPPAAPPTLEDLTKKRADNSACYVCHDNFQQEIFTQQHVEGNIGCVKCHGDSFAHRNDENNITPPEKMHPRETIDEGCLKCHRVHDVPATKILSVFFSRMAPDRDPKSIVCSDCHGEHHLAVRTVRWDKKTGELLSDEK